VAGIENMDELTRGIKIKRIERICDLYKDENMSLLARRSNIEIFTKNEDTVKAQGWPDYEQNMAEPNAQYADQISNLNYVAHAVS
jgi:hypothetical protein